MGKVKKTQTTFYGEGKDTRAIEFVLDLSKCFEIRTAKVRRIITPNKKWKYLDYKWRVEVEYE